MALLAIDSPVRCTSAQTPLGSSVQDAKGGEGSFLSYQTRDFDELALGLRNWDAEFRQLSRGAFEGTLQVLQVGGIQVIQVCANRVIQAQGIQREKRLLFSPVTPKNADALWKGQHLRPGQIRLTAPGEEMDHRTAAGFEILALNVVPEVMAKTAEVLHGIDLEDWLAGRFAFDPAPVAQASVEAHLRQVLQLAATFPHLVAQPEHARTMEQSCLSLLLRSLLRSTPFTLGADRRRNRRLLARGAVEFMALHLSRPLMVRDLCAEFDVSERTLEYTFREAFGLTPMAYFKVRRLNAVRQALKGADPQATTVHEIAQQWGFWHSGAFAADYCRLFGELPSETLGGDGNHQQLAARTPPRPGDAQDASGFAGGAGPHGRDGGHQATAPSPFPLPRGRGRVRARRPCDGGPPPRKIT
jgi:AraC family ethanolamine operon transcriptional activator